MASHRSTDLTILHAPKIERIYIHETKGPNRQERRHGGAWIGTDENGVKQKVKGAKETSGFKRLLSFEPWKNNTVIVHRPAPFRERYPSTNEPYLAPEKHL